MMGGLMYTCTFLVLSASSQKLAKFTVKFPGMNMVGQFLITYK